MLTACGESRRKATGEAADGEGACVGNEVAGVQWGDGSGGGENGCLRCRAKGEARGKSLCLEPGVDTIRLARGGLFTPDALSSVPGVRK